MKTRILIASLMVLLSVALFSCGGGGGGVAGSNSGDTNIFITTSSIVSDTNHSIDAATNTIETATISITAEKHIPEATPFPATVKKCSINYRPTEAGSPVLSDLTIRPDCPLLEGENTCEVVLIDFQRKQEFLTDSTHDPKIPTKYVAEYRCDYQNAGGAGNFPVKYDVWLADFTLPFPLDVFPDSAIINADGGSQSFSIKGGVLPYELSVEDPGSLVTFSFDAANNSFTVTGNNNGTGAVTIRVRDAAGTLITVTVTLK